MEDEIKPTLDQYEILQGIYDLMNHALFGGELPNVLITFQKKKGSYGYFSPKMWEARYEEYLTTDEIALNPEHLKNRTDKEIVATLVHEQVHCWQWTYGKPSRRGYHNKEWAEKMEAIGLVPSATGEHGGKKTGQKVTHYIITDGPFEKAFTGLKEECLLWGVIDFLNLTTASLSACLML